MDKTLKSILWVLVLLVVLSSFSTGWFFVAKERLYSDYTNLDSLFRTTTERLNREVASVKEENKELKVKLAAVEKELASLESRNTDLKAKYEVLLRDKDDLNKELARVKKGKFYLEKKIKDAESDVFAADLLKDKAFLEIEVKKLKSTLAPKDMKIDELKTENMNLITDLTELKEEKEFLAQKVKDSEDVAEVLSRDLLREKSLNTKDGEESESVRAENRFLKARVVKLEEAVGKFDELASEKDSMERKIAGLERDLEYKDREIDKMKVAMSEQTRYGKELRAEAYHSPQEVELPPIILENDRYTGSAVVDSDASLDWINRSSSLKGSIVTLNREHNFVVIDLGKYHGVKEGDRFNIYRGDTLIGALEAIQCRDRIAACDIKDIKEGFYIEIDDEIVKR